MKTIAVANQKGGVGKTTTAVCLAASLRHLGKQVLLIDLDPHACASIHLTHYPGTLTGSALDLFSAQPDAAAWAKAVSPRRDFGFALVPAVSALSDLEQSLRDIPEKGGILARRLAAIAEPFDVVIVDCPPHLGILLVNALAAAHLVLVPVQTDFLALHGLSLLFHTVRTLERGLRRRIPVRVLATLYDRRASACRRVLELMERKLGPRVCRTVISMDTKFREASAQGKPILDVAPTSRGAQEYLALAHEILTQHLPEAA